MTTPKFGLQYTITDNYLINKVKCFRITVMINNWCAIDMDVNSGAIKNQYDLYEVISMYDTLE